MDNRIGVSRPAQILMTVAALVVVVAGMRAGKAIIVPFLLAAFIAIISAPPLFWLRRRRIPSGISLVIVMGGVVSIAVVMAGLVGSSVNDFTGKLPVYQTKLSQQTASVASLLGKIGLDVSTIDFNEILNAGAAMKLVATVLNELGGVLTNGFLIFLTVIFMLLEASSIPDKFHAISPDPEPSLARLHTVSTNVNRYMALKTWVSLATGGLVAAFLGLLGVDYPLLWGLFAFLLNYIPSIGSILAAIPAVLLAIVQYGLLRGLVVAGGYVIINLVMGNVIEPRFMGKGLGLSTLVVFLSLLTWGWILGPVGMLLSVPLTMTVKIALESSEETRWISVLLGPAQEVSRKSTQARGTVLKRSERK